MRNPKDVLISSFYYYGMSSFMVNPGTQSEFLQKFLDGKGYKTSLECNILYLDHMCILLFSNFSHSCYVFHCVNKMWMNININQYYIYIEGIWQTLLSKATYKEYICWRSNISLWYIKIGIEQVLSNRAFCIHNYEVNRTSFWIAKSILIDGMGGYLWLMLIHITFVFCNL